METFNQTNSGADPGKRILVVDDMDDARLLIRCGIEKTIPEAQIRESQSGMKAAVELAKHKFDLVVSDLDTMGGSGFWLHCFMAEYHQRTPLVFFTSSPDQLEQLSRSRKVYSKTNMAGLLKEITEVISSADQSPVQEPEEK